MFSMCSEFTPRARIPDTRIPQLMQPCTVLATTKSVSSSIQFTVLATTRSVSSITMFGQGVDFGFMADRTSGKRRKNTEFFVSFQTQART